MSATKKPWVNGPFALISSSKSGDSLEKPASGVRKCAAEMSAVHSLLIRGINAIHLQAVNVAQRGTKKDKLDFSNFCWVWSEELQEHHNIEETMIFPEINELAGVPGLMDANVEEHKMFHDGLSNFRNYIDKIREEGRN
ncbi:hypothetical protein NW762_012633 [Fusarium torreyae]|uniref:Hemerythrin-like domain-containing protein n=1 Tax=Fusarium torreyae TaxID=1237075 RepID=A0A9W8RNS7_9HYPO|nr:hypothetical protein NW762_012633 [Fusarium torreyae]